MKKHKLTSRILFLLFLFALLAGLLSGCAETPQDKTVYATSGYSAPLSQLFPGYAIAEYHVNFSLIYLHDGSVFEAYDAQEQNKVAEYWVPLTLETIVIAIDRDQTDMPVTTWSDLSNSDADISIMDVRPYDRLTVAAMCYGLEGENFTLNAAVKFLVPLNQNGKLKRIEPEAPIQICFDSEAAARIKNGDNIEIVVPSEGTLSYVKGLLSDRPIALPGGYEEILLEHGLRLPDGRCDEAIYPAAGRYALARILGDYDHFNIVAKDWTKVMRREVRHIRLYTSADGVEHVMFPTIFVVLAMIWAGTMMRRTRQKNIRQVIFIMVFLLVGWIVTRVLRYQIIDTNTLTRHLWYGFYLFQSLLPLGLLRIASLIGTSDEKKRVPKWFYLASAFNILLAGLVMTNDLHGMMFKLDLSQPDWSDNYGYGFLYFVITAVLLLQIIGGIVAMFKRIKDSPRRFGVIFPLVFLAALIAYILGYVLGIPIFRESDMTLIMCIFALLFLEFCIQAGQIPVNVRYRSLFKNAEGLKLQITDGNGGSVFAANDAEPIKTKLWNQIKNSAAPVYADKNTLLLKNGIAGGYAVWQEDITAINRIKAEIVTSNRLLESANALSSSEAKEKERDTQVKTQLELINAFEKGIAAYEQRLDEMLCSVPGDEAERAVYLGAVASLVCYIKRRCNFLVLELSGYETVPFNEYVVYVDEMAEFAKLSGIQCFTYCGLTGEIRLRLAMLFFDFWASLLEWTILGGGCEIIMQTVSEGGRLAMRLTLGSSAMNYELPERVAQEIRAAGGTMEKSDNTEQDYAVFRLSFPAEGFPPAGGPPSKGGERDA